VTEIGERLVKLIPLYEEKKDVEEAAIVLKQTKADDDKAKGEEIRRAAVTTITKGKYTPGARCF
jgi:hypothetical protein